MPTPWSSVVSVLTAAGLVGPNVKNVWPSASKVAASSTRSRIAASASSTGVPLGPVQAARFAPARSGTLCAPRKTGCGQTVGSSAKIHTPSPRRNSSSVLRDVGEPPPPKKRNAWVAASKVKSLANAPAIDAVASATGVSPVQATRFQPAAWMTGRNGAESSAAATCALAPLAAEEIVAVPDPAVSVPANKKANIRSRTLRAAITASPKSDAFGGRSIQLRDAVRRKSARGSLILVAI